MANERTLICSLDQAHADLNRKILLMVEDLQDNKMDFAALKGDLFHTQRGLVFNEQADTICDFTFDSYNNSEWWIFRNNRLHI